MTSTGTWYPDPTRHHQSRYAEGGQWTEFVADDGNVSRDPIGPEGGGGSPRRRRHTWAWIVGALAVVVVVVVIVGAGIDVMMHQLDRYTADLTRGHGDFSTLDNGVSARSYQADGYHVLVRERGAWGAAALEAPTAHTVLGVELEARAVRAPAGAAFGPFCWQDATHGYGFLVDATGTRQLVQVDGPQGVEATVLASAPGAPLATGTHERLLLTCSIAVSPEKGSVALAGYVDGAKVLAATGTMKLSEIRYTGFAGRTTTAAPAEWAVRTFWRRGADDIPRG